MRPRDLVGLLPLALYLAGFTVVPVASTLALSVSAPGGGITLDHFRRIAGHYQFGEAVVNTLAVTGIGLALELLLGLAAALALIGRPAGRQVFQVLLLVPLGVPTIVAAAVMRTAFGTVGYLNEILLRLGAIRTPVDWVGTRGLALFTVAVADAWKVTPLVMLILLAGLQAIPGELYEAARTDGASRWRQFAAITLPLLKPALTMALIVRGVDAFRIFALPLALTGRGLPVLSTYAYVEYLEYGNPYTAAASSVILLAMILLAVASYLKLAGPEEVLR
ncbi:MAG: sugar ABC transporter permease [candidate division NC10 bacterium]|nr:sugar ABC transporter permease [candidate division NC10 bacterium]MBI2114670.1 sugar ABC transporter permease [candidate division NC10 bacterium]MBI2164044.1 sugar ABC transporter permease [candidate division NC10 bacterium]MBI2454569.1 sugar ABC transporter permease [candidate division NC10 bacterium]MBI3121515.1 sugar ABC transporter permease [candidate division NC10 bacterium]